MKIEINAEKAWEKLCIPNQSLNDIFLRQQLMQKASCESWKQSEDVKEIKLPALKSEYIAGTILPGAMQIGLSIERVENFYSSFMNIGNLDGNSFKCNSEVIEREFKKKFGNNWSSFGGCFNGVYTLDGEPVVAMQEYKSNIEIYMGGDGTVLCPFERISFWGDMNLLSRFSTGVANVLIDYYQKRNPSCLELANKDITMHL